MNPKKRQQMIIISSVVVVAVLVIAVQHDRAVYSGTCRQRRRQV
jgi:ABC-type cobalt transport system substrate-binding protein